MGPNRKLDDASPLSAMASSCARPDVSPTPAEARDRRFKELYSIPPDFRQLARSDPDLAAITKGRELDFGNPAAVMQLTKTLLKLDFGLSLQLPLNRLCPPVPNRHNYILWLKGLLDSSSYGPPAQTLLGLDIGTGASCIFPLLGCAQRPWSFVATDIDSESVKWARTNVKLNNLDHRIKVVGRNAEDSLIPLDELDLESIDFTMTNPPFYASEDQMLQSANRKCRPPWTACTGASVEMVVEGGELAFVKRILAESLVLGRRVRWYTSMLGYLSSVMSLVDRLKEHHIDNYAVTELAQGNKTRRWAVAWSLVPLRPSQHVARGTKAASCKHDLLPAPTEVEVVRLPQLKCVGEFARDLSAAVAALDLISWEWNAQTLVGVGRAADRVWARAWRRRKKREAAAVATAVMIEGTQVPKFETKPKCVLGFRVKIEVGLKHVNLSCRWVEGLEASTFESFQGFLRAAAAKSALAATQSPSSQPLNSGG